MKTRELVGNAFLAAILVIVQVAFSFLPNIEFVSLLIILYTLVFEKRTVVIIYLFALLESSMASGCGGLCICMCGRFYIFLCGYSERTTACFCGRF